MAGILIGLLCIGLAVVDYSCCKAAKRSDQLLEELMRQEQMQGGTATETDNET